MHWVQALIASEETLAVAQRLIPSFVVCPLTQGLAIAPITDYVEMSLTGSEFPPLDPVPPLAEEIAAGVTALATKLSAQGTVVYAATFIHGGTGGQDALVWTNGELVLSLHDDEENMSKWPNSPISRALRHIGVITEEKQDEFDAIGLGKHRSNEAWAKAYAKA
jgi:hypothetical protein